MAFSNPYAPVFECDVDRDNVLDSAVSQLLDVPCSELLRNFPSIAFLNEPGTVCLLSTLVTMYSFSHGPWSCDSFSLLSYDSWSHDSWPCYSLSDNLTW